jgi:nucleoside-diphosphate-sugar epimerase
MHILVTGAAGFIGSHLAERLVDLGHDVHGIDCFTDYYSKELKTLNADQLKKKGVTFHNLDLATDILSFATKDVEIIYHLAAQPGISATTNFETYVRNNIIATHRLLEAVRRLHTFRGLINISTSSVYGADATGDESTEPKPTSHYGVTKLAAEQLILSFTRDQGIPTCSLRLFSVYGPRERPEKLYPKLIGCILEEREFPLYEGSESHLRSYTYVGDVIDGIVAVLDNLEKCVGEIINIGMDTAITTGDGMRIVEEIIGKKAKIRNVSRRLGNQLRTCANIEKARRILEFNPATKPREGLEEEVKWYKRDIFGKVNLWHGM